MKNTKRKKPNISLCMIVKDELVNLGKNLSPLVDEFPEVIVVDTGSTDGSREYLDSLTEQVRVIDCEWMDDFSAARNQYIRAATQAWIYWMDADEHLDPSQVSILEECTKKGDKSAWAYRYQSGMTTFQIKLFPNLPGIRYVMRCHEQIYPSLVKAGVKRIRFFSQAFKIANPSYSETPQESSTRNIRLLKLDIEEHPEYFMSYVHLSYEYCNLGHYDKGVEALDNMPIKTGGASLSEQDRQALVLAKGARQMITLQKRLHKKMEDGKNLTREELQEMIKLGGVR